MDNISTTLLEIGHWYNATREQCYCPTCKVAAVKPIIHVEQSELA